MNETSRFFWPLAAIVIVLVAVGGFLLWDQSRTPKEQPLPSIHISDGTIVTLALGQTGTVNDVTITPREVVEDSRCPKDVQCIQAGRVRVRATLSSGLGTGEQIFLVGEPITTEAEAVTLLSVAPDKISTVTTTPEDYRFTFKVEKRGVMYANASSDRIRVDLPFPGAVVGKSFKVMGQARGNWFFEASFPITVLDKDGKELATVVATAQSDWMTTEFVPFSADVTVPESYIGPATILLKRDNASGLPEHDASAWYSIIIEY